MSQADAETVVETDGLTKRYGEFVALDNLSIRVFESPRFQGHTSCILFAWLTNNIGHNRNRVGFFLFVDDTTSNGKKSTVTNFAVGRESKCRQRKGNILKASFCPGKIERISLHINRRIF